ncbi:VOC family protein [Corynebacterium alimapuense]|uniref:VOC family protein n=1 Tax=Corynebacterium alimapuense TaxID=1576874 RepID=A0A3M8KA61_9CORY|nr:VOC family protein [Corynebacterium alimapuense]RNE50060.1 VOC family protein [Corynebacterium alimapuense]
MAFRFSPYISFPGNGREAMTYYQSIFGGQLELMTYGDLPAEAAAQLPFSPPASALAHGQLNAGSLQLSGSDALGDELPALHSEVYSFLISPETVTGAEAIMEKFTATGAEIAMPFELAPWGSHYGQLKDPFGILWAFDVDPV